MTIASRRQSRLNTGGMNFLDHSLRITNSAAIAAWRLRPPLAEELIDTTGGMNGTFVGSYDDRRFMHGPSGLHVLDLDGSTNMIDIYSSRLNTLLDGDEVSISFWAAARTSSLWTNSTKQVLLYLAVDGSNYLEISGSTTSDEIDFKFAGGGTADSVAADVTTEFTEAPQVWFHVGLSVSKTDDEMKAYLFGKQTGSTQTGIGTFAGSLDSDLCCVGSSATASPSDLWDGGISDLILYSAILGADEFLGLSNVR